MSPPSGRGRVAELPSVHDATGPSASALDLAEERRQREIEDHDLRAGITEIDRHLRQQDDILSRHTQTLTELQRGIVRVLLTVVGALATGLAALIYDIIR